MHTSVCQRQRELEYSLLLLFFVCCHQLSSLELTRGKRSKFLKPGQEYYYIVWNKQFFDVAFVHSSLLSYSRHAFHLPFVVKYYNFCAEKNGNLGQNVSCLAKIEDENVLEKLKMGIE